ncbi:putative low affinity iron protein [Coleophoma cylindrospora]|uniref:Putative low affinity iron protein n=1 Tax=Coleophoma cylindrospora TaxID=1849047 RepID=A0A3D8RML7_9HELO|nr:putative low affinity iron protein [Coleophoma cylindrospora]
MSMWRKFKNSLSPVREPIAAHAPTQRALRRTPTRRMQAGVDRVAGRLSFLPFSKAVVESEKGEPPVLVRELPPLERPPTNSSAMYTNEQRAPPPKLGLFDKVTRAAGSNYVFVGMLAIVAAWVVLGFVQGTTDTWQILMQNASSIQVYVTDILLLRQQSNGMKSLLTTLAEMQSRNQSVDRLIRRIPDCEWMETHKSPAQRLLSGSGRPVEEEQEETLLIEIHQMSRLKYVWNRTCRAVAVGLGSLWAFAFYWVGIFFWIGIGPIFQFSDTWQLYVNTATAVALTFTSVFLQNIQQQQEDNLEKSLEYATKIDAEVEEHLRELAEDFKPNPIFEIPPPKATRSERFIDYFADIMGSGIGVTLSLVVVAIWLSVGHLLEFDDNWWLIIGTFTGLVGFIDGFILRNVYAREEVRVNQEFRNIAAEDSKIFDLLNLPQPDPPVEPPSTMSTRVSRAAGDFSGLAATSIGSVVLVFILLGIASIMKWSETGQLLCNTPTMIIEGFLLLILIQAHNVANEERGREFSGILKRRLLLNHYVLSLQQI